MYSLKSIFNIFLNKDEDKDSMMRDFSLYLELNLQKVQQCLKQRRHSVNICGINEKNGIQQIIR